jgi:hypothetical protein
LENKLSTILHKVLTRKSSGDHQAKRRKEEKTEARGIKRHATGSALPSCKKRDIFAMRGLFG